MRTETRSFTVVLCAFVVATAGLTLLSGGLCGGPPLDNTDGIIDDGGDNGDGDTDTQDPNDGDNDTDTQDPDDPVKETEISSQTRVLNDNVTVELVDDNHLRLSGADFPTLHPGNVVVSKANGGLLARVLSVEQTGGVVTVQTEPASLTDVIHTGRIEIDGQLNMANAKLAYPANARVLNAFYKEGTALKGATYSVDLGGKATVSVSDISFDFNPFFRFVLDIDGGVVQHFLCTATGEAIVGFTAEVEVDAVTNFLEKEVEILSITWPKPVGILFIGGVPVVYEFYMDINLGAGVYADNIGTIGADLDASTHITAGAGYVRGGPFGGWQPVSDFGFDVGADVGDWSLAPIRAKVFIKPEFGIKFFKVVGPSVSYEEYLELVGDYRFDELGAELRSGREVNLNFKFDVLDMYKFKYARKLYDDSDVLMARLAYAADPPELGAIYYDPFGLFNFYWHTVDVDVWGVPVPDYELAGYSVRGLIDRSRRIEKTATLTEPVNASELITAHFVPEGAGADWTGSGVSDTEGTREVTVEVFPPGAGQVILFPSLPKYHTGDNLIVQAKANTGFVFHHWDKRLRGNDEPVTTFTVPGSCTIRAVFASDPPRTLHVPSQYATLQEAIDAATYNDIIELGANVFTGQGNRDLDFEDPSSDARYADNVTIRGQGCGVTVIDLQGSAAQPHRLASFGDPEGTIRFENLTIRNGYAGSASRDGGAIQVIDSVSAAGEGLLSLEIVNCCFENCHADDEGGAIAFGDPCDGRHFHVLDSTFTGCTGKGTIHIESGYRDRAMDVLIDGSTFTGNTGALDVSSFLGTLNITNGTFSGNMERPAVRFAFAQQATVADCVFSGNQSVQNGAALAAESSTIHVSNCSFTNNHLDTQSYGGAVWTRGEATFEDCTFTGNTGHSGAGAAVWDGGVLRHCTFDGNQAQYNGGALHLEGYATDCVFTNNTAGVDGGAVYLREGTLDGATVTDNTAGLWGGGIDARDATVSACLIEGNQSHGAGGIRIQNGVLRNSTVIDNTASNEAGTEGNYGGIMAEKDSSVYGCTVRGNRSMRTGGGILARDSLVSGCVIENNTAGWEGGGMVVRDSTVSDCIVRNNTASEGGGIWCWGTSSTVELFYDVVASGNTPDECQKCTQCP